MYPPLSSCVRLKLSSQGVNDCNRNSLQLRLHVQTYDSYTPVSAVSYRVILITLEKLFFWDQREMFNLSESFPKKTKGGGWSVKCPL